MSNNRTRIYAPAPFEESVTFETASGKIIEADKYMAAAIDALTVLDIPELLTVMAISHERIEIELEKEKAKLCDKALRYFKKGNWYWPETGSSITIDTDFVKDMLNQDVTKQTVYRRLKERRMKITEVIAIIDFFESNEINLSNPEIF